jgi:hypothetical protein
METINKINCLIQKHPEIIPVLEKLTETDFSEPNKVKVIISTRNYGSGINETYEKILNY